MGVARGDRVGYQDAPDDCGSSVFPLPSNVTSFNTPSRDPTDFLSDPVLPVVNTPPPVDEHLTPTGVVFCTPSYDDIPSIEVYPDCLLGKCSCVHFIGTLPCQLKPCRAAQFLFGSSPLPSMSDSDRHFIWSGLVKGFQIVDNDCPSAYCCPNYDSITGEQFYAEMSSLLREEIDCGKVSIVDSKPRCVHSLGAVTKSNGKLRPITDCSRPEGQSINNFMESTYQAFSYNSVDDAVAELNRSDYMSVVDIASAYRSVNVQDSDTQFQGLAWDFGQGPIWLLDHRLCFGLRCAPNIFNSISDFIVKIVKSWGAQRIVNYLDDFLVIAEDEATCLAHRSLVTTAMELLGFEVSWKKVTEPSPVTTFLGITIDSDAMELSLPLEKVTKLKLSINAIIDKGTASKKDLERIGGLVSYCSYVVRGGRTFSRRIFDLAASYSRRSSSIPLNDSILADLNWWLAFCDVFNGKACILRESHPVPLYSDASFRGFGAWLGRDWIYGFWDPSINIAQDSPCNHVSPSPVLDSPPKNINVYELWPVVQGVKRWAPFFRDSRMHIITDNMQVLAMLNTGRSTNRMCMSWLREIFWICFLNNLDVHATYIKSADNLLADALSRVAYHGVPAKCSKLLLDYNMCCSSSYRSIVGPPHQETEAPTGLSSGPIYQEITPGSAELL